MLMEKENLITCIVSFCEMIRCIHERNCLVGHSLAKLYSAELLKIGSRVLILTVSHKAKFISFLLSGLYWVLRRKWMTCFQHCVHNYRMFQLKQSHF